MIYITGDTHGEFGRFRRFCQIADPSTTDIMIILGDAGFNYAGNTYDEERKTYMNRIGMTVFSIHGNHERRPNDVPGYKTKQFHGGTVWYEDKYPNLLFAKDGEVYRFGEYDCIVIGGAYSVDKYWRLRDGRKWFANEQPSAEIKAYVEAQLEARDKQIDIVLSHTCPLKYEPREVFLSGLDQNTVDSSTEEWLDTIEAKLDYKKWYCGHFHTSKKIDRFQFMYEDIDTLHV